MAFQHYVQLDGKRYRVKDFGQGSWQPVFDRPRTYDIGLTGKTIIQDFTVPDGVGGEREPRSWKMTLQVYIDEPWPDASYANFGDFMDAYREPFVTFIEHDDTASHNVGIVNPVVKIPRVGANIEGHCFGVDWIEVTLIKVYQ